MERCKEFTAQEDDRTTGAIKIKTMARFKTNILISTVAIAAAFLTYIPEDAAAQSYEPVPVTISKEKVKIDGKICYSHIVLERQTLFSISKAYNVSIDDIYRFNPTLKETGLKKNGIILIPSQDAIVEKKDDSMKRQQALDSLTTAKEQVQEPLVKETPKKTKRKVHTVKWFEDLDVIAEKYGVSVESIMQLNNLESRKLTSRQKLQIPTPEDIEEQENAIPVNPADAAPATEAADSTTAMESPAAEQTTAQKNNVKTALLLPLNATETSSHRGNMDFYSGVLLAISDLTEKGIDIDLKVCDTGSNGLPAYGYISDCDFIIGPIASADLSKTLTMCAEGPYVISPLDQRAQNLAATQSKMIQAPTPHAVQYQDLIYWLKEETGNSDKVIFITEKGTRQTEALAQMQAAIDSTGIAYRNFSYSILEGRDVMNPLMALMTDKGANRVIIASESEAFVNDVVRNLNLIEYQKYEVVLYSPSKIRNFETIDVENIHNTSLHTSLSYYINYEDQRVKNFLMKYRGMFNTEPSQFAYQGYDIATYFINLVSRYGENWTEKLVEDEGKMLQSTFRFKKNPEGGYINNGVRRIIYEEGWTVKEMN